MIPRTAFIGLILFGAIPTFDCAAGAAPDPSPAPVVRAAPSSASSSGGGLPVAQLEPSHRTEEGTVKTLSDAMTPTYPTRILWLGDSHGQADLWTGALRAKLSQPWGDGGPGFVHIGFAQARNQRVRVSLTGNWRITPPAPSSISQTGDGIFGLAGVMGRGQASAKATIVTHDDYRNKALRWDVCYRLTPRDAFRVELGDNRRDISGSDGQPNLQHVALESPANTLTIQATRGEPRFCGVTVETLDGGVVVDNLGINGARLMTPLAWQREAWVAEVVRRRPTLVVLEYGTNESGDNWFRPKEYRESFGRVIGRLREAMPAVRCLVLAPTDRQDNADAARRTSIVVAALKDAAKESGCDFWNTYEQMGGFGAIRRWHAESPSRAAGDGVHLSARGYRDLGNLLADHILGSATLGAVKAAE